MTKRKHIGLALLLAGTALLTVTRAPLAQEAAIDRFQPVTQERLLNPDPSDWLMWRRTYDAHAFSPLDQITKENVDDLRLVWAWSMEPGTNQPTPLVANGIMFLPHSGDIVQALDAVTGELIWQYRRELPEDADAEAPSRVIALYDDKVFMSSEDGYVIALDARTGAVVWETQRADYKIGFGDSAGPMVVNGVVITTMGGCSNFKEEGCYFTAHSADNGEELWRFSTVARPGEPGGDTWGDLPYELRGGADTWNAGSYDPTLDLFYIGVAQPKPWVPASRGLTTEDPALYSSSTLAVKPETGELSWYYQHTPGEALDFDDVYERVLVDVGDQKLAFTTGKSGVLYKLDRETGEFIDNKELIFQNAFASYNETGQAIYRDDIRNARVGDTVSVCPSTAGGKDWQPASYYEPGQLLIVPLAQFCMEITGNPVELVVGSGGSAANRQWFEMPGTNGNTGRISAINVDTMEEVWNYQQRAEFLTGMLTTASGVLFAGDLDRRLRAFDVENGDILWETRLGTSVQGMPITYSVDGKQYLAVTTGLGGGSPRNVPAVVTPDIRHPSTGNQLYVFALPDE